MREDSGGGSERPVRQTAAVSGVVPEGGAEVAHGSDGAAVDEMGRCYLVREALTRLHERVSELLQQPFDGQVSAERRGLGHVANELERMLDGTLRSEAHPQGAPASLEVQGGAIAGGGLVGSGGPAPARISPDAPGDVAGVQPVDRSKHTWIVVVDDEPISRRLVTAYLEGAGLQVSSLACAADARELITQRGPPDLLLADVLMPGESGIELCRSLRRTFDRTALPIVMLTSQTDEEDTVVGLEAGANDYLTKPIAQAELLARVKGVLAVGELTRAYSRFVPREFLQYLQRESILEVELGDFVQRKMTTMFMDIRSFTTLSESLTPQQNFSFLNSYLQRVAPVVRANGGFIDKYVGDGIMALFPDDPGAAVRAAVEMRDTIRVYNSHRRNCGYSPIDVGIGVHTGELILGTIGYAGRMETTVISDSVNLASRLETLNKTFGTTTLISESTLAGSSQGFPQGVRYLGRVQVKGRTSAVPVFELFEGDNVEMRRLKLESVELFEQAVRLFEAGEVAEAHGRFRAIIHACPSDRVAQRFAERCQEVQLAFGPRIASREPRADLPREPMPMRPWAKAG